MLAVTIAIVYATIDTANLSLRPSTTPHLDPTQTYKGPDWTNERTVSKLVLGQTPFAKCEVHSVRSEDGKAVINDWIFMDERDAINVAVQIADTKKFAVFRQRKYAIPGETLSPVGGFIDDGETPFEAARREVVEELGLGSAHTRTRLESDANYLVHGKNIRQSKVGYDHHAAASVPLNADGLSDGSVEQEEVDWVFLGSYRTMANRGGGFIYTYLLKNAVPLQEGAGTEAFQGTGDDEAQSILYISEEEMARAVASGDFKEVKWAATMSLALLHLKNAGGSLLAVGGSGAPVP